MTELEELTTLHAPESKLCEAVELPVHVAELCQTLMVPACTEIARRITHATRIARERRILARLEAAQTWRGESRERTRAEVIQASTDEKCDPQK